MTRALYANPTESCSARKRERKCDDIRVQLDALTLVPK